MRTSKNKIETKERQQVAELIIDFGPDYEGQTTGSLADLVFQIESIFTDKKIRYCDRIFENGHIMRVPYCKKHKEYFVNTGSRTTPFICLDCEAEKLFRPKFKKKEYPRL